MITRMVDGTVLMDREDLAAWLKRSVATIRAKCKPVGVDPATRRALYDAEACQTQLADVAKRVRLAE